MPSRPPTPSPFPYTTLFRSSEVLPDAHDVLRPQVGIELEARQEASGRRVHQQKGDQRDAKERRDRREETAHDIAGRSEEHTSELQSRSDLVCRLLLEKKNTK